MIKNKKNNVTLTKYKKSSALIMALFVVFLFSFCLNSAEADKASSSAGVSNVAPVASSANIKDSASTIHLTENSTTSVSVKATITDKNGCEDIKSVEVKFFRTGVGASASDDDNNHYTVSASSDGKCTGGGSDLTDTYTATIDVNYYADPTDSGSVYSSDNWTAVVTPSDSSSSGTSDSDTVEMSTLTALNIKTASIAYGNLALGADTGSTDQSINVINTGNEGIDVDLDGYGASDSDGYAMKCTKGTIPIGNEKYSSTTSTSYSSKTSLTDSATKLDMDIPQRTSTTSSDDIYWGLGMPSQGVGGSCSGVVVFTANSDPNLD